MSAPDAPEADTEVLLAMLSSLLYPIELEQSVLLDTLVKSQGDIEKAAQTLRSEPPRKKRRISSKSGLDGWLKNSNGAHPETAGSSKPSSRRSELVTVSKSVPQSVQPASRDTSKATTSHEGEGTVSRHSRTPTKPLSKVKNVTNAEFMSLLRPPNSSGEPSKPQIPRHPPLTLVTPEHVAAHTPCTMHNSVLPPELACRLFYTMLHLSRNWTRNKWWLFDRVVESPHRTSFYIRRDVNETHNMREAAQCWYNGRPTDPPGQFPEPMEEACEIIERVVNDEMRRRDRFPLEWGGYPVKDDAEPVLWRANVAASNCYEGAKESVGFHSDQLTYLGPYPTIASLSLGVNRIFRLREVIPTDEKDKRSARTFNIPLRHNSLIIMHASTQEVFKHCVPAQNTIDMFHPPYSPPPELAEPEELAKLSEASNARINITFRFYRPDFRAQTTPRCRCDVPCILRPDMKNRYEDLHPSAGGGSDREDEGDDSSPTKGCGRRNMVAKYWWTCYAGAQNDGQGCGFWKVMDVKAEGKGPFVGDVASM